MTLVLVLLMALVAASGSLILAGQKKFNPFHPAFAFALPYWFITTGPAIRYLVWDIPPYGIHLDMLNPALVAALSAELGIVLGCVARLRWNAMPARHLVLRRPRLFRVVVLGLCLGIVVVNALAITLRWETLATLGKADLGDPTSMWQRAHYAGLLLLMVLTPAILIVDQALERKPVPWRSRLILGLFGAICLFAGERDIALVVVMIPLSWFAFRRPPKRRARRKLGMRTVLQAGGAFVAVALLLVVLEWARSGAGLNLSSQVAAVSERSHEQSVVQSVLGLGSNLFIVSRVVEWVPSEVPYELGMTYVHTFVNLMPSFVLPNLHYESLLTWFKMRYAPTSDSGYGFGMEAEAYLNFGLVGPLLVFALWAYLLCRLYDCYTRLPGLTLYRYAYIFFLPFSLYSIRGDSVMVVKGFLYAGGLVWVLARLTGVRRLVRSAPRRAHVPEPVARRTLSRPAALGVPG